MSSAPPAHQSKPSHNRRQHHNPGSRPQQRYVPKSAAPAAPKPSPPSQPSLTTALRSSAASSSASGSGRSSSGSVGGGAADAFVAYLPHDEAVAAGLGGLDAHESQVVVDLLNNALAALLRAKPREFWLQVAQNTSLHEFLDSYLQFRHRWYDLPHRGPRGTVAGLVVGELELCRRVFMVLYRISSNKDPGAGRGESLSMKEHAALLLEKKMLDLPKLLDICAIYEHDNSKLTSSLVMNVINVQPSVLDGINIVIPQFLNIFHTMHDRCMTSLQDSAMGQFKKEFGESDDEGIPEHSTKPADFDLLFAGDIDDHFLFGVKLTKKSIKLYSNFYSSDIIVASPLALKRKIDGGEHGKEKDFDFLSSIEIVVVDHADVISMQNWEHLEAVFEQLNQLPSKEHGTNVMRIRPWYLDQYAQYYRQTILLSSYLTPEINALFNGLCLNYEGKIKMVTEYAGVLPKIQLEVRQVYERFDASSIAEADDARFDYFCNKVYPKIQDLDEGGLLLFVSSYFEYIRISNFLKSKEASFCRIGEATSQQDISRSRFDFFHGKKKILLYSERSHFYHRYKIRGTKHLLIYSLPGRKEFYPELVNMLGESEIRKCNVLFSRLDLLKLERVVGTSSARRLISSDKGMFVFC